MTREQILESEVQECKNMLLRAFGVEEMGTHPILRAAVQWLIDEKRRLDPMLSHLPENIYHQVPRSD